MRFGVVLLLLASGAASVPAPAEAATSYRASDLQRAVVRKFEDGHGGTEATAKCTRVNSDVKWRCRLHRSTAGDTSAAFAVSIGAGGRWRAAEFGFSGYTAEYRLSACCLHRR